VSTDSTETSIEPPRPKIPRSGVKTVKEYLKQRREAKPMLVPNHPERPEIVYSVPPPARTKGGVRKFDHFYPFEDMKPGASFWVPSNTYCTAGAISKFAKRTGWKFTSRGETENGVPNAKASRKEDRGTRVWRLK